LAVLVSDFEEERSAWNRIGAPDPLLNMEEGVDSSAGTK